MMLFSTLSQGNILLLFTYLGFASGCVFFLTFRLTQFISTGTITRKPHSTTPRKKVQKNMSYLDSIIFRQKEKKRAELLRKKQEKKQAKHKCSERKQKKVTAKSPKRHVQMRKQKSEKRRRRLHLAMLRIMHFIRKSLAGIINIFTFATVLTLSVVANIHLNFGRLSIISLSIYVLAFLLARLFLKILAKLLHSLYNRLTHRGEIG